jgi:hypothetical protein
MTKDAFDQVGVADLLAIAERHRRDLVSNSGLGTLRVRLWMISNPARRHETLSGHHDC